MFDNGLKLITMEQVFYSLKVIEISKPTYNATTVSFTIPKDLLTIFQFHAGQHLCFKFTINGKEEERMYSLHNSPFENGVYQITSKIKDTGIVSKYIATSLKLGDIIKVSEPKGNFVIKPTENCCKTHYFFAAGSGITPIFSMIKTILLKEKRSKLNLLYSNRNTTDILFYKELSEWKEKYSERLEITHTLTKRFLDTSQFETDVKRGRINEEMIEVFLNEKPLEILKSEFYICGPGEMNQMVFDTLTELGVPAKLISYEYFSSEGITYNDVNSSANVELNALIRNVNYQVILNENETVLQGLKRVGAPVPFSCQNGICGTCKAKLTEGKVEMKSSMALSANDKKQNYILSCQSMAQSTNLKIDFE